MCVGAQNNYSESPSRALICRCKTPSHSRAAASYFRGSFCTMRNSLLQLTRRRSKEDRAPGQRYRVCSGQWGHSK
jgi:hypothetical protein